MDPGDHNEGEKHHLRNFIAMRVKFFSRILSSTLWQKLSRKLISWSQLMIQSKWWEVGRIIPYVFVMYDLYFCHFKTYEILHSVLRHPVHRIYEPLGDSIGILLPCSILVYFLQCNTIKTNLHKTYLYLQIQNKTKINHFVIECSHSLQ